MSFSTQNHTFNFSPVNEGINRAYITGENSD